VCGLSSDIGRHRIRTPSIMTLSNLQHCGAPVMSELGHEPPIGPCYMCVGFILDSRRAPQGMSTSATCRSHGD
jgi:hypothetical protein